ncbi:hypothetical protein FE73_14720, partial [Staphylococcus aureus]
MSSTLTCTCFLSFALIFELLSAFAIGVTLKENIKLSPAYLSNILEQDFYGGGDTKGKNIKGMTIGLAMNSVYYYKKEKDGSTFSKKLDDSEVKKQGKQMASEILSRL